LNAYRHGPRKAIVNKIEKTRPYDPSGRTNTRSQSQTRANARKFETTKCTTSLWTPEAVTPPHGQQTTPAPELNGTDFRYAVEFSKYGRTPATTARPSWGQPWKHYPARFAVSNLPDPIPSAAPSPAHQQSTPCGVDLRGIVAPRPQWDRSGATW